MEQNNNIKKFRKMRGIKLRHFAQKMGVTESYIWQLEQGKKTGSLKILMKMADELGVSLEDLIGSADQK